MFIYIYELENFKFNNFFFINKTHLTLHTINNNLINQISHIFMFDDHFNICHAFLYSIDRTIDQTKRRGSSPMLFEFVY